MISVVLLMAGAGNRMNMNTNKILLPLGDKLIFEYPLKVFLSFKFEVICVIARKDENKIITRLPKGVKYVYGGSTRQESVRLGLSQCTGEYVLIHDAARALIHKSVIQNIVDSIENHKIILTYHSVKDTIKIKDMDQLKTIPRDSLIAASTPQCAPLDLLRSVYEKAHLDGYNATDDISLIEHYYPDKKIHLILGNEENFKITTPLDYTLAKAIVEGKMIRIGHAWDVHPLVKNRKLILGGIELQSEVGLLGHSDADVVLHAVAESLLGSLALGDLGVYFPDTKEEIKNIDSKIILEKCYQMVLNEGYQLINLDLTIYSQYIKISPVRIDIQNSISKILNIEPNQVSIKATTYEKMGFIGRGEAIACECVCLVENNK